MWCSFYYTVLTLVVITTIWTLHASAVPNSRARFGTAASPLEPQSFKSLRRGYRTGTKERKCHGFDEEVSLPTFLCKNRKVTPFAKPEGRHFEFSRNHFHFLFFPIKDLLDKAECRQFKTFQSFISELPLASDDCPATSGRFVTASLPDRISDQSPQVSVEVLKRFLSIFNDRIFDSSVDRGMPSLAAAPDGPNTRPWHSRRAASISSFS
jgi:hypothetical protein